MQNTLITNTFIKAVIQLNIYKCRLIFLLFYVILINNINSQTIIQGDTTDITIAEQAVSLIKKSDSLALADSINKTVLLKQLEELNTFERAKRKKIENELEEIRKKDSLTRQKSIDEINLLKKKAIGWPVYAHKDTLFKVYTKVGSISAQERAMVINDRLEQLYRSFFIKNDSLVLQDNGQSIEIYFNDKVILSVTELDELWFEQPKTEIASEYKNLILKDITTYKKDQSFFKQIKEIGLAILVIGIIVILIKLVNYLFRTKVDTYILNSRGKWLNGIKFKNHEILDKERQATAILFLLKIVKYAIILLLLYLTLPLLFLIFPPTQRLAEVLFGYILTPLKTILKSILSYIPKLISIVVIVTVTRYFLKFIKYIAGEIESEKIPIPGFYADWAKPTYNIVKVLVYAFMFIVIFPYLPGSESNVFKGVSVFIGVVFSLGSSSIIGNMVAGLVITYMRPFKIGDRIKIGDVVGNVIEKTPFVTRIRTPKKEFITIPNSNVLSSNVINYSNSKQQGGLIVHTTITIGYDVPWRKVHHLMISAAKKTNFLNHEIAPYVLQTALNDFYVSYQVNAHTNEPDKQPQIYSELHENIQDAFNEAGIEILSPHYRADRDGNASTIPVKNTPHE